MKTFISQCLNIYTNLILIGGIFCPDHTLRPHRLPPILHWRRLLGSVSRLSPDLHLYLGFVSV